jgi:hypothetical protein
MKPAVGLLVRIDSCGDPAHDTLGWIDQLQGRIAHVTFGRRDRIARWFAFSELVDERIFQMEAVASQATLFQLQAIPFDPVFASLQELEALPCRA